MLSQPAGRAWAARRWVARATLTSTLPPESRGGPGLTLNPGLPSSDSSGGSSEWGPVRVSGSNHLCFKTRAHLQVCVTLTCVL